MGLLSPADEAGYGRIKALYPDRPACLNALCSRCLLPCYSSLVLDKVFCRIPTCPTCAQGIEETVLKRKPPTWDRVTELQQESLREGQAQGGPLSAARLG